MVKKRLLLVLAIVLLTSTFAGCTRSDSAGDESSPKVVLVHATVENRMDRSIYAYPRFTFMDDFRSNAQSFEAKDKWSCNSNWAEQHPDVVQWPDRWRIGPEGSIPDNCRILYPEESSQITLELSWSRQPDSKTEKHTLQKFPLKGDTHFQVRYIVTAGGDVSVQLEDRSWDDLRG